MKSVEIKIKQGQLKGGLETSKLGREFIAFRGVPYAKPPLGKLRFKDPQPPSSWEGVRDALENRQEAVQVLTNRSSQVFGNEDCLYLNVYTRCLKDKKKAVYVWIHGGGFFKGNGNHDFGPDYLLERDIVVVTVNYRLGALGFFNLNHKDASGNQGLKDQVAALKWVQENIAAFGGDKDNVTIGGNSGGSLAVHCLSMSPITKGLFKRIIMHSGVADDKWTYYKDFSCRLAKKFVNDTDDPEKMIAQLQKIPAHDFVRDQFSVMSETDKSLFLIAYGPCMDTASEQPLLPGTISQLLPNSKDIPTMMGYVPHEFLLYYFKHDEEYVKSFNKLFDDCIRSSINIKNEANFQEIKRELQKLYLDGRTEATIYDLEAMVDFMSDLSFTHVCKLTVQLRRQMDAPTYLFHFNYYGSQETATTASIKPPVMKGVSHGDEMPYIFYLNKYNKGPPPEVGTKDRITIERMTRLIGNFVKFGDPTRELDEFVTTQWKPVTRDAINQLEIGDELVPDVLSETSEKYKTWAKIYHLADANPDE